MRLNGLTKPAFGSPIRQHNPGNIIPLVLAISYICHASMLASYRARKERESEREIWIDV